MERTSGMKQGLKLAATSFFLMAALLSTGCSSNMLMNPVSNTQGQGTVVNPAGQPSNPAGQRSNP
jgi:hypothetical protein